MEKAMSQGMNFYAYRPAAESPSAPDHLKVRFASSSLLSTDMSTPGFMVAPFDSAGNWPAFVIPSAYMCLQPFVASSVKVKEDKKKRNDHSTDRADYDRQISSLISHLKRRSGKVVLSRIICGETRSTPADMFMRMCCAFPTAFVFCFYTPFTHLWIGASPELLLSHLAGRVQTMSLAGTRAAGTSGEWDAKNIEEQKIVTDYICDTMRTCGMRPELGPRYTRMAGAVEHLCNDISADLPANISVPEFLDRLAPTPALCGYPRQSAMNMIRRLEKHDRAYYGGYVGIGNGESRHTVYVNLRSVNIRLAPALKGGTYTQFCGGGITASSLAEAEWEETCIKSRTMQQVL